MPKELTEADVATYVVTYRDGDRYQGFRAAYVTADESLYGMLVFKNHLHQTTALVSAGDVLTVERAESDPAADSPPPGTGYWPCGCPVEGAKAKDEAKDSALIDAAGAVFPARELRGRAPGLLALETAPADFADFTAAWEKACIKAWDAEDGHWSPTVTLPDFLWPRVAAVINPVTGKPAEIRRTAAFSWGPSHDGDHGDGLTAQAEADAAYISAATVASSEIRDMRNRPEGDGEGTRL